MAKTSVAKSFSHCLELEYQHRPVLQLDTANSYLEAERSFIAGFCWLGKEQRRGV